MDCCSRMGYNPINNYITALQSMLEAMEGTRYLPVTKVLLRRDCALSTTVLEVLEGMLCVLRCWRSRKRALEVVLHVL